MKRLWTLVWATSLVLSAVLLLAGPALAATELELWTFIDPAGNNVRSKTLDHVLRTFEQRNPGITVKSNIIQWDQLSASLLRGAQARRVPDVSMMFSPFMPIQVEAKTLTPVSTFIPGGTATALRDYVIFPEAKDNAGTIFGIPFEMRVGGMIYNTAMLKQAGVQPPQSLQELARINKELTQRGQLGWVLSFSVKDPSLLAEWVFPTLAGMGVRIVRSDGKAAFDTPASERLVQWVYDLVTVERTLPLDVAMMGSEEIQQLVVSGRAAMQPKATHRLNFMREQSGLGKTLQMTNLVSFDASKPAPAQTAGWNLVIPRNAPHPQEAWKLVQHWTSPEMQVYQAKSAGYIPIRASALEDPWFKTEEAADIRWAVNYASKYPMDFKYPSNTDVLYDVWARMFEKVLTNAMKPKEALRWAEEEYNSLSRR